MLFEIRWLTFLGLFVSLLLTWQSKADTLQLKSTSVDFEIYDVFLDDGLLLFESTDVYIYEGKVLLPFNTLISALEINLSYDHRQQRFTGRLNSKDVDVSLLNLVEAIKWPVVVVDEKEQIFIDSQTFGFLIDAEVSVESKELKLVLKSKTESFPLQVRIARINRKVVAPNESMLDNYDFIIDDQYRLLTPFSGNVSFALTANETEQDYNINVNTYNDLFYHSANLSLAKNTEGELTKRLTLSRETANPTEKFIGGINRYSFGDVSSSNNRSNSSFSGTGFVFSSFENRYSSHFGKVTIDEYVTANWSVELYRDGFLIDTGVAGADGHIVFNNIDVNYGSNRFEIKTYGDFGEKQNIIREVLVGQNLLRPGKFQYAGGVVDTTHSLLNDNGIFNARGNYSPAVFFQSEYGLNQTTSLGLSVFVDSDQATDISTKKAIISVTHQLSNALLDINFEANDNNSYQLDGNLIGSLSTWTRYNLGINYNNSKDSAIGNGQTQAEKVGIRGNISGRVGLLTYGFSGSIDSDQQTLGANIIENRRETLSNTLSWRYNNFNINNQLSYSNFNLDNGVSEIGASATINQISVSSALSHSVYLRSTGKFNLSDNGDPFRSIDANLNWNVSNKLNINTSAEYFKNGNFKVSSYTNWQRDDYNLTFGANFSNDDRWQLSLGVSFGLDYDYYQNKLNLTSEYGAASGTLDLLTYIDNNKNAVYDEYDEALENVGFGSSSYWRNNFTNKNGNAYLPGVSTRTPIKVYFDTSNTRAPNLKPVHDNFVFYTHPGGITSLDVPMNYGADLQGQIVMGDSDRGLSVRLIPIQLLNKQGDIIKETITDIDNFYAFSDLWPGQYQMRIEPEFLSDKSLTSVPETMALQLTGADDFVNVADFILNYIDAIDVNIENNSSAGTEVNVSSMLGEVIPYSNVNPRQSSNMQELSVAPSYYYSIQLGAYSDSENCIIRVNELKIGGMDNPYYQTDNRLCKVLLGKFSNKITAHQELKKIQSSNAAIQGFVTRLANLPAAVSVFSPIKEPAMTVNLYWIQLGAYSTTTACDEKLQQAKQLDLPLPKQQQVNGLCKVFIGEFDNKEQALKILASLPALIVKGAFVVRI